ncbi:hypothetical protein [Geminocystis sp. NIES-3709]|uniref:hypothetical protein n=1 Tax=Geminocystis sp. NIES-3709 TaxID=1617448 RepID=UPI0005FC41EC|nr:hypothetical protein [Geminocystis sp. NIES-3709]BAQ64319.1 alkaline phosphatase [Geminocystis sp. NIES-3709]
MEDQRSRMFLTQDNDLMVNLDDEPHVSQYYEFTYNYGNGDFYSGYGYTAENTYTEGQILEGFTNSTDNSGYYTIDLIDSIDWYNDSDNFIYITTYYDDDGGFGKTNMVDAYGDDGLGSESGWIYSYNENEENQYFNNSIEVDLDYERYFVQYYEFTYYYGNGDFYSGYGYTSENTYTEGQILEGFSNSTDNSGYYTINLIDSIEWYSSDSDNSVYITNYHDSDTGYGDLYNLSAYGNEGLGSESGDAYQHYNWEDGIYFDNTTEIDLNNEFAKYTFTYYYSGDKNDTSQDYYSGYIYAPANYYQIEEYFDYYLDTNEAGFKGKYYIEGVELGEYSDLKGTIALTNYYDAQSDSNFSVSVDTNNYTYLGWEYGYIDGDFDTYKYFGSDFHEANPTVKNRELETFYDKNVIPEDIETMVKNGNTTSDSLLNDTIYRFRTGNGGYIFVAEEERQNILQNEPNFIDEGSAFRVSLQQKDDLIAFNRFQNTEKKGAYLYATEAESISIRENNPEFVEEGIAFYAFDGDANKGIDFYRFNNNGSYIYVAETEKDQVMTQYPDFILEGIAFEAIV